MSGKAAAAEGLQKGFSLAFDKLQIKGVVQAKVLSVDGNTCDVELQPGVEMYGVRLNAIEGPLNTEFTITPLQGSKVLVAIIENVKTEGVVVACSEIEKVYCKIGTAVFQVRDSKIKIEAEGVNLKTEINNGFEEVKKIIVLYGRGPNVPALTVIQENIAKVLE